MPGVQQNALFSLSLSLFCWRTPEPVSAELKAEASGCPSVPSPSWTQCIVKALPPISTIYINITQILETLSHIMFPKFLPIFPLSIRFFFNFRGFSYLESLPWTLSSFPLQPAGEGNDWLEFLELENTAWANSSSSLAPRRHCFAEIPVPLPPDFLSGGWHSGILWKISCSWSLGN